VGYDTKVQHGIIATETDQSASLVWSNTNTLVGVTNQENGQAGTDKITQTEMMCCYAAKLCKDLTLNGYDDWYLPSLGEVSLMYDNKNEIGGFGQANYWTSTEYDTDQAYAFKGLFMADCIQTCCCSLHSFDQFLPVFGHILSWPSTIFLRNFFQKLVQFSFLRKSKYKSY
jgi:hypothetical protein